MAKGTMYVDGVCVPFDGEKNGLAVIRKAGIDMPTFCYYSELSTFGACRMCVVENEQTGKIDASCSMEPRDGLRIRTNALHGKEDGGRPQRIHARRSARHRSGAHHAGAHPHDQGSGHPLQ